MGLACWRATRARVPSPLPGCDQLALVDTAGDWTIVDLDRIIETLIKFEESAYIRVRRDETRRVASLA
jgi:hypothetical protein